MIPLETLRDALIATPLFAGKTWKLSPEPWTLTPEQTRELRDIGAACLAFHRAQDRLYMKSAAGEKLLRNGDRRAPAWIASLLDAGKPAALLAHARHPRKHGRIPAVLRPDLLLTDDGWALTELDSVPGGIGLTAYLNATYAPNAPGVIGGAGDMPDLFYRAVADAAPRGVADPFIVIVVSDEAATYRPEFDFLAETLRARGRRVRAAHPDELTVREDGIAHDGERIDVIYRFFELFDLPNLPVAADIMRAVESGRLVVTPPMRPHQEEKLTLALLHHPELDAYWREALAPAALTLMRRIVPPSWLVQHAGELPPAAILHAPPVGGLPIRDWSELAAAGKKDRDLILKISGFHETAWGARGVTLGSDVPAAEWAAAVTDAAAPGAPPHLLQTYRKPAVLTHPVFDDTGATATMRGRLRLCPYYFVTGDTAALGGALATFCPADKKIIHGMRDAVLLPCREPR